MNLADYPDKVVATTNDEEAQWLLADLGLLEKFKRQPVNPGALANKVTRLDMITHPTHWITAVKYEGFERPEDNGFAVRCLPKSAFPFDQVKLQFEAEKKEQFPDGVKETID